MPKAELVSINPAILRWARAVSGYGLDEAAHEGKVSVSTLTEAENVSNVLTIPQLRRIAAVYKRPIDIFYLSQPPTTAPQPKDFRTVGNSRSNLALSPELRLEWRKAHIKRDAALEILMQEGASIPSIEIVAKSSESPEVVAERIRSWLKLTRVRGLRSRDADRSLRVWMNTIEAHGVLVFQTSEIEVEEARGLSYWSDALPFILLNSKDGPRPRLFTLMHELVHLVLHEECSACTPLNAYRAANPIESFCNQVAAAVLMPSEDIRLTPLVVEHLRGNKELWSEDEIKLVANLYGVSRQVLLIRLFHLGIISNAFVQTKFAVYEQEYREEKSSRVKKKQGVPQYYHLILRKNGRKFSRLVLTAVNNQLISEIDASTLLDAKPSHFENMSYALKLGGMAE